MEKKELRKGYTTGTCAAIAAKAAVKMIFTGEKVYRESVLTPKGITITTDIQDISFTENSARCAVVKDGGDDPDVTTGAFIYAEVILCEGSDIVIDGGEGVGRVTKPGLWQAVGEAAINKVPRQMIRDAVKRETLKHGYNGGIKIVISVPEGEKLAKKTFNPRLGIIGGISILGTSGIVEPMSEQALIDTIAVEMKVAKATFWKAWRGLYFTRKNSSPESEYFHPYVDVFVYVRLYSNDWKCCKIEFMGLEDNDGRGN